MSKPHKEYCVSITVPSIVSWSVEATSPEVAKALAIDKLPPEMCDDCYRKVSPMFDVVLGVDILGDNGWPVYSSSVDATMRQRIAELERENAVLRATLRECESHVYRQQYQGKHADDKTDAASLYKRLLAMHPNAAAGLCRGWQG